MVVVVMMGLLASAASLTLTKPLRQARAADALETIRTFDESARTAARRLGHPAILRFHLDAGVMERLELDRPTQHLTMPHGFRIEQIRTAARRESEGDVDIPCSPLGITRTYAVRLEGPGEVKAWLLISGFSGEVTTVSDESKLDAIFSATATRAEAANAPAGHDAD